MSTVKPTQEKYERIAGVPFISHPNISLDLFLSMGLTYKFNQNKINLKKTPSLYDFRWVDRFLLINMTEKFMLPSKMV